MHFINFYYSVFTTNYYISVFLLFNVYSLIYLFYLLFLLYTSLGIICSVIYFLNELCKM